MKPVAAGSTGIFSNRQDAGRVLAQALRSCPTGALIAGISRGGVAVAAAVADELGCEFDVVVARTLGAPGDAQIAIGAVAADGTTFLNEELIALYGVSEPYIRAVTFVQGAEAQRQEDAWRGIVPAEPVARRTVVVVDDGLASGATMRAALRSLRRRGAGTLIAAAPVGAIDACASVAFDADEVVCPEQRADFGAVGLYYQRFDQVTDREVRRLLEHRVMSAAGT